MTEKQAKNGYHGTKVSTYPGLFPDLQFTTRESVLNLA